jgi:hypothetical protein
VFLCFFCLLSGLCDTTINALLSLFGELWVCSDLFLLDGFVDDVAETFFVDGGVADHDLLVDLVHVSLVLCVGREQSISFLIATLIFLSERDDGVFGNGIGELSTIEVTPVEDVVVNVEGVVGAAGVVVASAAALITQDSVGESDLLELFVGGILIFRFDLVYFESGDEERREQVKSAHQDAT